MKWSVIGNKSRHKTQQRFVSMWSQIWLKSMEISINCQIDCAPFMCSTSTSSSTSPRPILILLFASIGLTIATVFGNVNGDFNNVFNGLNNENNECDLYGALTPITTNTDGATGVAINTTINFGPTDVGLHEFDYLGFDLTGAGPATTTTTIAAVVTTIAASVPAFNFNDSHTALHKTNVFDNDLRAALTAIITATQRIDNENIFNSGPLIPLASDTNDTICVVYNTIINFTNTGIGLRELNVNGCVFNVIWDVNGRLECDFNENL